MITGNFIITFETPHGNFTFHEVNGYEAKSNTKVIIHGEYGKQIIEDVTNFYVKEITT